MNKPKRDNHDGIVMKKRDLVIAAILLLLLVAGAVILGMSLSKRTESGPPEQTDGALPEIDSAAESWHGSPLPDEGGASVGIKIPGYPSITLPADTGTVEVALLNPEGNPCYFTFELALRDSGEVLYTSKLVPPGQAIYQITLARPLPEGEYNAVIRISTASLTDLTPMNGANVETVLIVRK